MFTQYRSAYLAFLAAGLVNLMACSSSDSPVVSTQAPVTSQSLKLASLGVAVSPSASRAYIYTNKDDAYFYGEAAGPASTSWEGFNVRGFTFVDDWQWVTSQGNLGSTAFTGATIYPDHAVRQYPGGLSETITLIDGKRALLVEPDGSGSLTLRPLMSDSSSASAYVIQANSHALAIERTNHTANSGPNDHPVWLVVKSATGTSAVDPQSLAAGGLKPKMMSPGSLTLKTAEPVVFAVGDTVDEATAIADTVLAQAQQLKAARAARMQALLDQSYVVTQDSDFNRGMAWIRLNADALVMNQLGKGVFAGIPWFNNYWGRDTFITLAGSHLATGQWEEAKDILTAFSSHQDTTAASATYGRIPNFVSLDSVAYNTADGTPWFVVQAYAYVLRSGDTDFAKTIWPVIQRATDANLARVDANNFLTHGDQETWMDATGPNGSYTPRGNRAVEIQGLWYQQLKAAAGLATLAGQTTYASSYTTQAAKLAKNFQSAYYNSASTMLYDHLNTDGSVDTQVRPNQFLALRAFAGVLDASLVQQITRKGAEKLVYPQGVASLAQTDDAFHPYHIMPGYYPKDEAYHNGVVWGWLSGPVVSLMVAQNDQDKAYQLLQYLDTVALSRGTVGTLPELMDALPRLKPGTKVLGSDPVWLAGTPYQAWSHGEYLRNVYEDFLGVAYLTNNHVSLTPKLPASWGKTVTRFRVGAGYVTATLTPGSGALDVTLQGEGQLPAAATITVNALGSSMDIGVANGTSKSVHFAGAAAAATGWDGFDWQAYWLNPSLAALNGSAWTVLMSSDIKQTPDSSVKTLLSLSNPAGNDTGPAGSHYVYPTDSHFAAGIFDLTAFEMREDANNTYYKLVFANLVQPGWNPQDGFQLTYAAVLLDTGAGGQIAVSHNANYSLPSGSYQYAIYIGAGLEVQDGTQNNKVIAVYTPYSTDVVNPLGSVDTKAITFAIPKTVIPKLPAGTKVTILTGGQDDGGNGSMGNFRSVTDTAGGWNGGGNPGGKGPNVYDFSTGVTLAQ